jgi:hypothetical protein
MPRGRLAIVLLVLFVGLGATLRAEPTQQKSVFRQGKAVNRRYQPSAAPLPPTAIVKINISGTNYDHLTQPMYTQLRSASMELLKRYPPDQHVYIGLGRDPAPFVAFLQEIGTEALNFPSSGRGHTHSAELDRHFAELIPAHIRNGQKTIVLIDQTSSGKTHNTMMPLLRSYLQRTGSSVQVKGVAFYSSNAVRLQGATPGLETINTTAFPEVNKFMGGIYENIIAPYERHTPSNTPLQSLKWRPQYDQFRQGLGQRIERDQELDTFLSQFDK